MTTPGASCKAVAIQNSSEWPCSMCPFPWLRLVGVRTSYIYFSNISWTPWGLDPITNSFLGPSCWLHPASITLTVVECFLPHQLHAPWMSSHSYFLSQDFICIAPVCAPWPNVMLFILMKSWSCWTNAQFTNFLWEKRKNATFSFHVLPEKKTLGNKTYFRILK